MLPQSRLMARSIFKRLRISLQSSAPVRVVWKPESTSCCTSNVLLPPRTCKLNCCGSACTSLRRSWSAFSLSARLISAILNSKNSGITGVSASSRPHRYFHQRSNCTNVILVSSPSSGMSFDKPSSSFQSVCESKCGGRRNSRLSTWCTRLANCSRRSPCSPISSKIFFTFCLVRLLVAPIIFGRQNGTECA